MPDLIVRPNFPNDYAVFKRAGDNRYTVIFSGTKDECREYVKKEEHRKRYGKTDS